MTGKASSLAAGFTALFFQAKNWSLLADNTVTTPLTVLWISLHIADPGFTGAQNTSEATYGNYARTSVARTTVGWTETSGIVNPVAAITFPVGSTGTSTVTHMGIGSASSGAGVLYYSGTVTPNLSVSSGVTPQLTTATSITES